MKTKPLTMKEVKEFCEKNICSKCPLGNNPCPSGESTEECPAYWDIPAITKIVRG